MKDLLFKKIRLTYYFVILFVLFMAVIMLLPSVKFESGALMLFSVNSFFVWILYFTNFKCAKGQGRGIAQDYSIGSKRNFCNGTRSKKIT